MCPRPLAAEVLKGPAAARHCGAWRSLRRAARLLGPRFTTRHTTSTDKPVEVLASATGKQIGSRKVGQHDTPSPTLLERAAETSDQRTFELRSNLGTAAAATKGLDDGPKAHVPCKIKRFVLFHRVSEFVGCSVLQRMICHSFYTVKYLHTVYNVNVKQKRHARTTFDWTAREHAFPLRATRQWLADTLGRSPRKSTQYRLAFDCPSGHMV